MRLRQTVGRLERQLVRQYLQAKHVPVPASAVFFGFPVITVAPDSVLRIGERFNAISGRRRQVMGLSHACVIRTVLPGAELIIGDDVGMSGGTICAAYRVRIGSNCLIGANATIIDTNFHPLAPQDRRYAPVPTPKESDAVTIGENVFIGAGAYILRGTTIGDNSVIGAGSVVSGDVPSGVIFAGNPARLVRGS